MALLEERYPVMLLAKVGKENQKKKQARVEDTSASEPELDFDPFPLIVCSIKTLESAGAVQALRHKRM